MGYLQRLVNNPDLHEAEVYSKSSLDLDDLMMFEMLVKIGFQSVDLLFLDGFQNTHHYKQSEMPTSWKNVLGWIYPKTRPLHLNQVHGILKVFGRLSWHEQDRSTQHSRI